MTRRFRLTKQYTVEVDDQGVAIVHHSPHPLWPWYWMDATRYFRERERAYRRLVMLVEERRIVVEEVRGYSLWLDYTRDGFTVHTEPADWYRDKLGLISLWILNTYNWRPSRFYKLGQLIRRPTVYVGHIKWAQLASRY